MAEGTLFRVSFFYHFNHIFKLLLWNANFAFPVVLNKMYDIKWINSKAQNKEIRIMR